MLDEYEIKLGQWALKQPEVIQPIIESDIISDSDLRDFLKIIYLKHKNKKELPDIELYKIKYPTLEPIFHDIKECNIDFLKEELHNKSKANIGPFILDGMANGTLELGDIQKQWKDNIYEWENKVKNTVTLNSDITNIKTIINKIRERQEISGIKTGFTKLDNALGGGWRKGDTHMLIGGSGIGKSIFLANFAGRLWELGNNVLYITTEMTHLETSDRIIRSTFNTSNLEQLGTMEGNTNLFGNLEVVKVNPQEVSCIDVENIAMELDWKVDIVIIDYFDEIKGSSKTTSEYDKHGVVGEDMKILAFNLDVPVVTVTQASRKAKDEKGGSVEHVGTFHLGDSQKKERAMTWHAGIVQTNEMKYSCEYKLTIGKSRFGDTSIPLEFKIDYSTMRLWEPGLDEEFGPNKIKTKKTKTYVIQQLHKDDEDDLIRYFEKLKDTTNQVIKDELNDLEHKSDIDSDEKKRIHKEIRLYRAWYEENKQKLNKVIKEHQEKINSKNNPRRIG